MSATEAKKVRFILFDLGGTLVQYYTRDEFPPILDEAIAGVKECLQRRGLRLPADEEISDRTAGENHEADDYRVRPLRERLGRIFGQESWPGDLAEVAARAFLRPILARSVRYDDTLPTLEKLRAHGLRLAIVSNSPWGSPPEPWQQEVARHGLDRWVETSTFCGEVGWRKPARQIFEYALEKVGARPEECLFVGDHPQWDVAGPQAVGIGAILIDRNGAWNGFSERVCTMAELEKSLLEQRRTKCTMANG